MTIKDIPTHFATTITTTNARIIDYRERKASVTHLLNSEPDTLNNRGAI